MSIRISIAFLGQAMGAIYAEGLSPFLTEPQAHVAVLRSVVQGRRCAPSLPLSSRLPLRRVRALLLLPPLQNLGTLNACSHLFQYQPMTERLVQLPEPPYRYAPPAPRRMRMGSCI